MADKRTYKEIVASLETQIIYINNHLQNIDKNLEKLNTRTRNNEKSIAKIYGVGGGIIALSGIVALILKIVGVY